MLLDYYNPIFSLYFLVTFSLSKFSFFFFSPLSHLLSLKLSFMFFLHFFLQILTSDSLFAYSHQFLSLLFHLHFCFIYSLPYSLLLHSIFSLCFLSLLFSVHFLTLTYPFLSISTSALNFLYPFTHQFPLNFLTLFSPTCSLHVLFLCLHPFSTLLLKIILIRFESD